jgi:flavin reductase (DIM6/NTAB) family NADH-FMN oxidoreductase RutF
MTVAASCDIAPKEFREVLGSFATGVTVITAVTAGGERLGSTASSFNSVSLDPPLILFSLARSAKAFDAWQSVEAFAVNILTERQDALSTRFARPLTDKWKDVETVAGPVAGLPLLPGALASMECSTYARYDGGDHIIMVGRAISLTRTPLRPNPLIFYSSRYRKLDRDDEMPTPRDADLWLHGW